MARKRDKERAIREHMRNPAASGVEKALAVASGVAEGFAEEARAANLPEVAGEAVDKAMRTTREVREGAGLAPAPPEAEEEAGKAGKTSLVQRAQQTTKQGAERMERWAGAVAESAERAAEARAALTYDVRTTARVVMDDLRKAAVGYGITALAGLFALAGISIVVAVLLNQLIGNPWGTLIVTLLYVVVAVVAYTRARENAKDLPEDAKRGVNEVKGDVRGIWQPLREARRRPGA